VFDDATNRMHLAAHENDFLQGMLDVCAMNEAILSKKERAQVRNLKGIVQYAKELTAEITEYRDKVDSSESIVQDLNNNLNAQENNLGAMLRRNKKRAQNTREEIRKQEKLDKDKLAEIENLQLDIEELQQQREFKLMQYAQEVKQSKLDKEHNTEIIKRQSKLIVDLHQKNELCATSYHQHEERVMQQFKEIQSTNDKIKETTDQRKVVNQSIVKMHE